VVLHYKAFYFGKTIKHVPKLEISHCRKNWIKEKTNFLAIGPVVFAPGTQTCATELKKWEYSISNGFIQPFLHFTTHVPFDFLLA
jgi:hypothetical protein